MACDITLWAQITNTTNDQAVPMLGAGHDYIGTLNEIVNPANGSLSIRLPLPIPPSRGISMPSQIAYNSSGIIQVGGGAGNVYATSNKDDGFLEQGGWNYGIPALTAAPGSIVGSGEFGLSCPLYTGFVFDDPQGSRYAMGLALPNYVQCNGAQAYGVASYYQASDADGFYHVYTTDGGTTSSNEIGTLPFTVYDNSGTTYHFAPQGATPGCTAGVHCSVPDYIEDKNGNIVRFTQSLPFNETDSAGRSVLSIPTFTSTTGDQIAVSGISSPYVVTWKSIAYNFAMSGTSQGFSPAGSGCGAFTAAPTTGSMNVVQSIELPNGTSYRFDYDPVYGMLSKITYPSGAYVQYSWGTATQWSDSILYPDAQNESDACQARYAAPAILHRYVSYDGSTVAQQQDFQYQTTWNGTNVRWEGKQTLVTTTDELRLSGPKSFTTVYTYLPWEIAPAPDTDVHAAFFVPLENVITYNDYSGSTMRTVTKTWKNPHLLASEQITENGLAAETTYKYSGTNIIEKDEYDYGQANPTRTTLNQYESFAGRSAFSFPSPIYDRPCQTVIHSGTSAGAALAETDYFYDNESTGTVCGNPGRPSLTPVSGLPSGTHDEATYSASSTTSRANVTAVVKKCLEGCTTDSTTTYTYDVTGQALTMTDPCGNLNCSDVTAAGHTTQYSYSDKWSSGSSSSNTNAYVTKVTDQANHVIQYAYDYATGNLGSLTDANKQQTTYAHNDSLLRLTDVYEPPSPQNGNAQPHTHYAYTDGAQSTTTVTNPLNGTTVTTTDGMGHVTAQETLIGSVTLSQVDTTYNGMGNAQSVSNPHTSATQSTDGRTQYCYDALGRKTLQVQPDNTANVDCTDTSTTTYSSAQQWTYSGNVVTFTDESGNQWQRTTDALGRLTKVLEPSGTGKAPSMETDYAYDALDNLLSVIQCGAACPAAGSLPPASAVVRNFAYDSLSHLISASNPESGTTTYSYDANGNLQTKTSPAVNAASGTQTIGYCYDALNRITAKFYNAPNCATSTGAVGTYTYDVSSVSGASNVIGRLTDEKAYIGGALVSERTPYAYDPMGRLQDEQQCPFAAACATPYTFHYRYDLAGDVISSNNGLADPATSLTFGFSYDSAGRMSTAGTTSQPASWDTTTYPTTLQAATQTSPASYDPMGHLVNAQLGLTSSTATPALTLARQYDNRGRITLEMDDSITFYQIPSGGYAPNGNVLEIDDSLLGTWQFGYDTLNRLVSGVAQSGQFQGDYGCWGYDAFGNRTLEALSSVTMTPCAQGANDNAIYTPLTPTAGTNRMSNFFYDGAGNVLYDGANAYAYDAEGRLCEVAVNLTGPISYYQYVYDAEGRRVAKGSTTSTSCGAPTGANQFTLTNQYLLGKAGEQVTELAGSNGATPAHTNVWSAGNQLSTYDFINGGVHFALNDLVGTKRIQVSGTGVPELTCATLPFGNNVGNPRTTACAPWYSQAPDATEHHFTGKERDTESGLDNFGARYYGSNMGRFMSPDIIGGDLSNPQSLNRYTYVLNNPLSYTDFMGFQVCTGTTSNGGSDPAACAPSVDEQGFAAANQGSAPNVGGGSSSMPLPDLSGNGTTLSSLVSSMGGMVSGSSSLAQGGLDIAGMIPGPVGIGANLASAGISAYNGHYGAAALSLAFAAPYIGQFGEEGYASFRAFKAAEGLAADGMQWHHIVEQTPGNLARFGPGAIHDIENLVQVPKDLHIGQGSISAYYSSKDIFTGGQTVRQWLAPQSFGAQRDFGLEILRGYGIIP